MVYFPLIFLAISGLLARISFAIPVPNVTPGQVVHITPAQTIGQHFEGPGADVLHPHILLGHENGNAVLAPVTHAPDDRNGPYMTHAGDLHPNLEGNILLHHVTANPANMPQTPSYGGRTVNPGAIQEIKQAKKDAAFDVHSKAGDAHIAAAESHESAAKAQKEAAKQYQQNFENKGATAAAVQDHLKKATEHHDAAAAHEQEAIRQKWKALKPEGPMKYAEYANTQASKDAASQSHKDAKASEAHAKAATENIKASVANSNAGNHVKGFQHVAEALKHAPSAPAKPDAEASHNAAKNSVKNAGKGKR